ncbi:MAG: hypothetical protein JJT78_13090 [Leptospira sp.]|nr:hypothetical protein [Leptospira sp.]
MCIIFLSNAVFAESKDLNPWRLSIQERILTRKNISHIVIDPRQEEFRLVILTSDRYPYNYKQQSFPFFFRLRNEKEATHLMKKISDYLETGEAMTIHLNGSEIKGVIFHEPYEEIP